MLRSQAKQTLHTYGCPAATLGFSQGDLQVQPTYLPAQVTVHRKPSLRSLPACGSGPGPGPRSPCRWCNGLGRSYWLRPPSRLSAALGERAACRSLCALHLQGHMCCVALRPVVPSPRGMDSAQHVLLLTGGVHMTPCLGLGQHQCIYH